MPSQPTPVGVRPRVPPPVLFFALLAAGVALQSAWPISLFPDSLQLRLGLGMPLFGLAAGLGSWALSTLRQGAATPSFGREVNTLVRQGPYRLSRNPLYVTLVLGLAAFAVLLDNGWLAFGCPALGLALDRLVIAREEAYLGERFGGRYSEYVRQTRRWL